MKLCFHIQPKKPKARKMLNRWLLGCSKRNVDCIVDEKLVNVRVGFTPVFYGVSEITIKVFNLAIHQEKPWLYIDNQYFIPLRGKHFRVTWNALQVNCSGTSNGKRLIKAFGGREPILKNWVTGKKHILITLQSELYFKLLMPYTRQEWLARVIRVLRKHTDRQIIVREKPHPSRPQAREIPFAEQLRGCHAIVTLSSATATEGIMEGIPAFVTDHNCGIVPVANLKLSDIENPEKFERMPWLRVLADNQWSIQEFNEGFVLDVLRHQKKPVVPAALVQESYLLEDIT